MMNLIEGLIYEINRNRELLKAYEEIGPAGKIGAMFIKRDIQMAEEAMGSGDLVAMMRSHETLKASE